MRNSLFFTRFGAKLKACKTKKCLFKGKSIERSQPTSVSQVKPYLMISLSSFGPWASVLCEILCILAIFGPYRRPARPENFFFGGKSIGRSQATSVSQVKPDLMISLGSLGPWASILYEILYILAVLGPNQWPAGPKIFQRGQKKTGGYQKCLFIPFLLNVCAFKPLLTDIRCQWVSIRAK